MSFVIHSHNTSQQFFARFSISILFEWTCQSETERLHHNPMTKKIKALCKQTHSIGTSGIATPNKNVKNKFGMKTFFCVVCVCVFGFSNITQICVVKPSEGQRSICRDMFAPDTKKKPFEYCEYVHSFRCLCFASNLSSFEMSKSQR